MKRYNSSSWSWWESLAGIAVGGPAATVHWQSYDGYLYKVYHTGTDGAVYQKTYNVASGTWDPPDRWSSLSGVKTSSPAAAGFLGPSPYYVYVLARGQDEFVNGAWNGGLIWYRRWNGSQWEWWLDVGQPP